MDIFTRAENGEVEIISQQELVDANKKGEKLVVAKKVMYRRPNGSRGSCLVTVRPGGRTRTKQSDAAACDINNIVKKHTAQDVWQRFVFDKDSDGVIDVASIPSYRDALNQVIQAQEQFQRLPSHIRKYFGNSPEQFVAFCSDKKNMPKMVELGLAREIPPAPQPAPATGDGK